jgi:hypothetical protein
MRHRPWRPHPPAFRAGHENTSRGFKNLKFLPKVAEDAPKEFGWSTTESVALAEKRQTADYWNTDGDLVIRQRCWPDDDALIFIAGDSVDWFIDKLADVIGNPSAGKR